MLHYLAHVGLNDPSKPLNHLSCHMSQAHALLEQQLISPVLAFVKAFRLKGDNESLKSTIASRFDAGAVSSAVRTLWDFSGAG